VLFGLVVFAGVSLFCDVTWVVYGGIVLILLRELYRFLFGG